MSLAGRLRLVAGALAGTVVALFAGWLAFSAIQPGRTDTTQRSTPAVLRAVQDLASYTAASGSFQVLVDSEEDVNLVPSFIAGERSDDQPEATCERHGHPRYRERRGRRAVRPVRSASARGTPPRG